MTDAVDLSRRSQTAATALPEPDPLKGGDVYGWAMDQAALIRAGRFDEVDIVNVADEIESVGKSEFRSLKSHIEIILLHMLKWDNQPTRRSRSWIDSIEASRDHVVEDLVDNPSLKARRDEAVESAYRLGRRAAARQTRLETSVFPTKCPFDWDTIMTRAHILDHANEDREDP